MEVTKLRFHASALEKQLVVCSFLETAVVSTLLAAQKSLTCLLMLTGALLNQGDVLPDWSERRFPMDELYRLEKPGPENKDRSDTENDGEDDDDDAGDQDDDDDAGDEDFSGGEEGGDDDDEGDPEDDPEANGNGGSDDEDENDDDDDDQDEDGDDDEEEEEEDEDEEDQPPAKKRK